MKNYGTKSDILIKSITKNSGNYDENYMDIKFNSEDDLPLKKQQEMIIEFILGISVTFKP